MGDSDPDGEKAGGETGVTSPVTRARSLSLLHLVSGSAWRGSERQALGLAAGLAAKGHRLVLAVDRRSPMTERAAGAGLDVKPVSPSPVGRLIDLRRLLSSSRWDIVHHHDVASLRSVVWACIGMPAVPCVLTVRGDVVYGRRVLPRGTPLKRVGRFFAASEMVWSALVRAGIPEDKIAVIHTAVDLDRFRPAGDPTRRRDQVRSGLGLDRDDFVVGSVVSLTGAKGVDVLIAAAQRIRTGRTAPAEERIRLLIVGDGPWRASLEQTAREARMEDAVIFTGRRDDVPELLAAMDVYAHAAVSGDGFPVALREAMAMTVPVVATDLMGIREIIDNGKQGLIVPAGDPDALALNVMRMRRDPVYAQQLGKNGNLKVQRYSVQAMVDRAEELYFRLVR